MPYIFWIRISRYLLRVSRLLSRLHQAVGHASYLAFDRAIRRMLAA